MSEQKIVCWMAGLSKISLLDFVGGMIESALERLRIKCKHEIFKTWAVDMKNVKRWFRTLKTKKL